MKRWLFAVVLVFLFYLMPYVNTQTPIINEIPPTSFSFSFENSKIKYNFLYNSNRIDLTSITKKDTGFTFDVSGILWRIRLIDLISAPTYNEVTKLQTELNCQTSYNIQNDGVAQILYMNWIDCAVNSVNKFNLTISIRLDQDLDYGNWRVFVNSNMNDYSILYVKLFFGILENPNDFIIKNGNPVMVKNPANTFNTGGDGLFDGGDIALSIKITPYWTSNNQGLYFISKDSLPPHYQLTSYSGDGNRFYYGHGFYPEYIGVAGNDLSMDYDLSIGIFTGDWYDAAMIYRSWALNQPWADTPLISRNDIPTYWKELDLGESRGTSNSNITFEIDSWKKVKDFYNASNMVVFYWQGGTPVEYQPVPWVSTVINELNDYGIRVLMYTNPQVIITTLPSYSSLTSYLCKDLAGQPYIESGTLVRTDYTNPGWHSWYADKVRNNIAATGFSGIFLEIPLPYPLCYNLPNPVGGIHPWQGMINLMNEARSEARELVNDFVVMYEFLYEAYFEVSDSIFTPTHLPYFCTGNYGDCNENYIPVPFLPVVYHDIIPMLGHGTFLQNPFIGTENYPYLDNQIAMDFSWGLSIHTAEPFIDAFGVLNHEVNQITDPAYINTVNILMNHTKFLREVIKARKYGKNYLVYGKMLREVPSSINDILITFTSNPNSATIKRIIPEFPNSVWKAQNNKRGIVFANPKLTPATFIFSFPLQTYGLPSTPHYGLYVLNESGSHLVYEFNGNLNNYIVQMPPKSVRIYEIYQYVTPSTPTSCGATYPSCSGTCPSGQSCQQVGTSCQCIIQPPSPPTTQPIIQPSQPPTIVTTPPTVQQPPPGTIPTTQQQEIDRIKKKYSWKNYKLELAILLIILIACVIIIVKNLFKGGPKMTYGGK